MTELSSLTASVTLAGVSIEQGIALAGQQGSYSHQRVRLLLLLEDSCRSVHFLGSQHTAFLMVVAMDSTSFFSPPEGSLADVSISSSQIGKTEHTSD